METTEIKKATKKPPVTKKELLEKIKACNDAIDRQIERRAKLQEKLDKIKKEEILDAIVKSGKSMEEILDLINL